MSETPGEQLQEEPQEERGPEGSRDEGSDEPGGGPVDRPAGTADGDDHTGINPDDTDADHPEAPDLQSGGN